MSRRSLTLSVGMLGLLVAWLWTAAAAAQAPSPPPHPIPATPPGAVATRPPGPWVDPPAPPEGCRTEVEPNDRSEGAASLPAAFCVAGTLVEDRDQDLYFYEVLPEDGLVTWQVTVRGVPTTYTSVHVLPLDTPAGVTPIQLGPGGEVARVDSDVWIGTPPGTGEVQLAPGAYLLGISRGIPGYAQDITEDLGYWVEWRRGDPPAPSGDHEPNDDPTTATAVRGAFVLSGDLAATPDMYRWTLGPQDVGHPWRLAARSSMETRLTLELAHADGTAIAYAMAGRDGVITFHDLGLVAGEYLIELPYADGPQPYELWAEPVLDADIDREPDDAPEQAHIIDPETLTAIGRLTSDTDVDQYVVDIDATLATSLVDVGLAWADEGERQLCLATESGLRIGCEYGRAEVALRGLLIPPGRYLLTVSGDGGLGDRYRLRVAASDGRRPEREVEPNDDLASAGPLDGGFVVGGDLLGGPDAFLWTLDDAAAARTWHLDLAGTPGLGATMELMSSDGTWLARTSLAGQGTARIWDLRLPAGTYAISLTATSADPPSYVLRSTVETEGDLDPEPDDLVAQATMLDPMRLSATGRITTRTDEDRFRLEVDEAMAATLTDIRLESSPWALHQVCLATEFGSVVQCIGARGGSTLRSLDLAPGPYTIAVSGDADPTGRYTLAVLRGAPRSADAESEPNDRDDVADVWDPSLVMRGTSMDGDLDTYRIHIPDGEPIVWRLTIAGPGLSAPDWRQPDGTHVGSVRVSDDATEAVIDDLYLVSGDHLLTIRGGGGYSLALEPIGPPDLAAEREPNDDADHAGPLRLDGHRTGRLPAGTDVDVYRFSLAAPEHVSITTSPDAAGGGGIDVTGSGVDLEVTSATTSLAQVSPPTGGGPTVFEGLLPQGDYEVWVRPSGGGVGGSAIPDIVYGIRMERGDPFIDPAAGPPAPLDAQLELELTTNEVAAYRDVGQRVTGTLRLADVDGAPVVLALDARTSHHAWTVELPPSVEVPAGGSVDVPVVVGVPADAWRDVPVRVTIRARTSDGSTATTWTGIVPRQDAPAIAARAWWPLPDALLGGLDVASLALGGAPIDAGSRGGELHDGVVIAGTGRTQYFPPGEGPVVFDVDLAGDDPVPIAGTIIDPLGGAGTFGGRPRAFQLLLSLDGETWTPVLAGELGPQTIEQAFVLPAPVEARFARLQVDTTWSDTRGPVELGEWKVVAPPGFAPPGVIDLADPVRGGHMVASEPPFQSGGELLTEQEEDLRQVWLDVEDSQSLVIGFADSRAAQLTGLTWRDMPGVDPATLVDAIEVSLALDSPMGPWVPLGTWQLDRSPDGSAAPFSLRAPVWARYIRLVIPGPTDAAAYRAMPAKLGIAERPTDDVYRSILGQWGQGSPRGIQEVLVAAAVGEAFEDIDVADAPADASPLAAAAVVQGVVARNVDVDWYLLHVPSGDDTLTVRVDSERAGDVRLRLVDANGTDVAHTITPTGSGVTLTAIVGSGADYRLELLQPILSVMFTFDTSSSIAPWFPLVRTAIGAFADGVRPGLEAVQVFPFEEPDLLEGWSDQAYLIRSAIDAWTTSGGSSGLEASIERAAVELSDRDGARAVLAVGDGVGGGFLGGISGDVLAQTRPAIFPVHVGGQSDPIVSTHIMQDLALVNGGHYQYATSLGEMERAFERMSTWLRRPARYALSYQTSFVDYPPGAIEVQPAADTRVRIGGVAVGLVLDTSGSMLEPLGGSTRIEVAKQSLSRLVGDTLPEGLPVALRTFKAARRSCDTVLAARLAPLDRAAMQRRIQRLKLHKSARTPLAKAIAAVAGDLAEVTGPRLVVIVTDGAESCKGDPEAAIRSLIDAGFETTIDIVGLALEDDELKTRMASWAELGGGVFFDAQDADGLAAAIGASLRAPFRVLDEDGAVVGTGVVGGDPVVLPIGSYRVEVSSEPPVTFDGVRITPGESKVLVVEGDPS